MSTKYNNNNNNINADDEMRNNLNDSSAHTHTKKKQNAHTSVGRYILASKRTKHKKSTDWNLNGAKCVRKLLFSSFSLLLFLNGDFIVFLCILSAHAFFPRYFFNQYRASHTTHTICSAAKEVKECREAHSRTKRQRENKIAMHTHEMTKHFG